MRNKRNTQADEGKGKEKASNERKLCLVKGKGKVKTVNEVEWKEKKMNNKAVEFEFKEKVSTREGE